MKFGKIFALFRSHSGDLEEDELYRIVWEEIERGEVDSVAQARSIEAAGGDQGKIRAAYIKHRVRRLRDELTKDKKAALDAERDEEESRLKDAVAKAKEQAEIKREDERRRAAEAKKRAWCCSKCGGRIETWNFTHSGMCKPCFRISGQ